MPDRLVLFDIDCTLIDAHGAGGRAILRAIKDVYGVEGELGDYSFHGRTDPGIISDLAALWGGGDREVVGRYEGETQPQVVHDLAERSALPAHRPARRRLHRRYVELLRDEIDGGEVETLPGIRELVTALAADRRALVGLLTGNVVEGARLKLEPTGLFSLFKVGAYGSDSALRAELPAVAVARAEALTGRRYAGKDVVVIGDTPADVECGASLGVTAVAVATGRHSRGRAGRTRAGPPLRRPLRLARGLRRHHGLTCVSRRSHAPRDRPRAGARPAQLKRRAESGARSIDGAAPPASCATRRPVTGPRESPSMQWPVARITRSRPGTRPITGRPSGVTGRGPRQSWRTGPSAGTPMARCAALPQVRHAPGAHAHVPAGQLQRAAQTQRVAQRRQDDVGVAQVQRQLGEVRRPLHVHAVALRRLDRQPQTESPGELRRPGAGRQHHLGGLERAARRDGAHAPARRFEREHLRTGLHVGAGILGEAGPRLS